MKNLNDPSASWDGSTGAGEYLPIQCNVCVDKVVRKARGSKGKAHSYSLLVETNRPHVCVISGSHACGVAGICISGSV